MSNESQVVDAGVAAPAPAPGDPNPAPAPDPTGGDPAPAPPPGDPAAATAPGNPAAALAPGDPSVPGGGQGTGTEKCVVEAPLPNPRFKYILPIYWIGSSVATLVVSIIIIAVFEPRAMYFLVICIPFLLFIYGMFWFLGRQMKIETYDLDHDQDLFTVFSKATWISKCAFSFDKQVDYHISDIETFQIYSQDSMPGMYEMKMVNETKFESNTDEIPFEDMMSMAKYILNFQSSIGNTTFRQHETKLIWGTFVAETPPGDGANPPAGSPGEVGPNGAIVPPLIDPTPTKEPLDGPKPPTGTGADAAPAPAAAAATPGAPAASQEPEGYGASAAMEPPVLDINLGDFSGSDGMNSSSAMGGSSDGGM